MSTQNQILAGSLENHLDGDADVDLDVDTIARIQFYTYTLTDYNKESGDENIQREFVGAVPCSEKYKDSDSNTIQIEFGGDTTPNRWICPDVEDIKVDNDPFLFTYGTAASFVMVVNDCETAVKIDKAQGLTSYSTVECASSDTMLEYIPSMILKSKMMTTDTSES